MASMVIRNIPDDVLERFRQRAKSAGKSAEQLAREAIAEKAAPDRAEIIRRIDEIRASTKRVSGLDIIEEIRRDRETSLGKDDPETGDDR
jgi:plasmid stability protein